MTYLICFIPDVPRWSAIVSQSFKDLLAFSAFQQPTPFLRFFKRIAKVRAFIFLTKFYLPFYPFLFPGKTPDNWCENQLILQELHPFFLERIAKVRVWTTLPNFNYSFLLSLFFKTFSENYPSFERGCKCKGLLLPVGQFQTVITKFYWMALYQLHFQDVSI